MLYTTLFSWVCRVRRIPPLLLLVLLAIVVGGCASTGPNPTPTAAETTTTPGTPTTTGLPVAATVILGKSSFAQTDVTISAGQVLRLVDPGTTGGTHVLCLGTGGQCDAAAQGPDLLHGPGLTLHPGDTKDIPFPSPGSYEVTCTIHPGMHLTISVLGVG